MPQMIQIARALLFAPIGRRTLLALMAFAVGLAAFGIMHPAQKSPTPQQMHALSDTDNYKLTVERMAQGQGYYSAVVERHRAVGYPLKPVIAVRLPTLAVFLAQLPSERWRIGALWLLSLIAIVAFVESVRPEDGSPAALGIFMIVGLGNVFLKDVVYLHEAWAAVFMVLSLAARRHLWLSVSLALIAVLLRELALPFLVAMTLVHVVQGRWGAASAWLGAILIFGLAIAIHATELSNHVTPNDLASQGWLRTQGWPFIVRIATMNFAFALVPAAAAIITPFALVGLLVWRSEMGVICCLTIAIYVFAFMIIGRPENRLWGLMLSPFLLLGIPALAMTLAGRPSPRHEGPPHQAFPPSPA